MSPISVFEFYSIFSEKLNNLYLLYIKIQGYKHEFTKFVDSNNNLFSAKIKIAIFFEFYCKIRANRRDFFRIVKNACCTCDWSCKGIQELFFPATNIAYLRNLITISDGIKCSIFSRLYVLLIVFTEPRNLPHSEFFQKLTQ